MSKRRLRAERLRCSREFGAVDNVAPDREPAALWRAADFIIGPAKKLALAKMRIARGSIPDIVKAHFVSHQDTYKNNEAYAEFLANWDPAFYSKYTDFLKPEVAGSRVLDVGCGAGQVIQRLCQSGFEAFGVDVSEPNIQRARRYSENCQVYDGRNLPFPDRYFTSTGALNVLEHVEEPEAFIRELVRVTADGGRIVLSSPNFFRVIGFRDYHPRMRGLGNKLRNLRRLLQKLSQMKREPSAVRFDRMTPIIKEPFTPDDDAIVATNPLEMKFFLSQNGCEIDLVHCTDRYVAKPLDILLNFTPARYLMFNAFVVAHRREF